jgi:hypothetical protein
MCPHDVEVWTCFAASMEVLFPIGAGADEFGRNSCFDGEFPVPGESIPCFIPEQGIVRRALELQGKWTPEPGGRRRNGGKFQKFPAIFPALREKGAPRHRCAGALASACPP